jgi:hypothetical protein
MAHISKPNPALSIDPVDPARMQILHCDRRGAVHHLWVTFRLPGQRRVCQPVRNRGEAHAVYAAACEGREEQAG